MSDGKISIEKFDGSDFGFWKMQIEDYLYGKDLYQPLKAKPEKMDQGEWELLDRKAMSAIRLSLSKNVAYHTTGSKSAREMLATLEQMYQKPTTANKVHLIRRLFNLKMSEGTLVQKHLNEFHMITGQLRSVEIEFDDEVRALIMLSSLPESWGGTVTAVSASSAKAKLSFDEVRDLMISEEIRRKESGSTSGSALNTEERGRSKGRQNRGRSKSRGKSRSGKDKDSIKCWNCDEYGHYKNQCEAPKKNRKDQKDNKSANAAADDFGDALVLSISSPLESWVLDSGASFHSCSNAEVMEHYISDDFGQVYLADDEPLKIVGKGDVRITTPNGSVLQLNGVRHIPGLKRNLLSIGQLDTEGYSVTFGCSGWKITRGAMIVARGKKDGTLYTTTNPKDCIDLAGAATNADLWHCRLGHMSKKGMKVMWSKGRLPGLKTVEVGLCEDCVFGKQRRVSFSRGGRTLKIQKLELVHSDLWGPAPVKSLGGSKYYMTFIDDSTRKV